MEDLERTIRRAFPDGTKDREISDTFIESHPSLLELSTEFEPMVFVPAYMIWCIRNRDRYDQVVTDHTLDAIANYGRASHSTSLGKFKAQCDDEQRAAVVAFLEWCVRSLVTVDQAQIERSRKRWQVASRLSRDIGT